MKTKTITTTKGEFLILEIAANIKNPYIFNRSTFGQELHWINEKMAKTIDTLPAGNWQILGFIADLSVHQADEIVSAGILESVMGKLYELLQANNVLLVNPFGEDQPILNPTCCGIWQDDGFCNPVCCQQPVPDEESRYFYDEWLTAEQNTFRNALILKQI